MKTTKNPDFERGLDRIGGEVFGHNGRFVRYYADETSSWYRVNRGDVARLGRLLLKEDNFTAYSLWCAECPGHEYVRPPC